MESDAIKKRPFRHPGERIALHYLLKLGHLHLANNYHTGATEIDLITIDPGKTVHFIEVKSWTNSILHPIESLTSKKVERMREASLRFLAEYTEEVHIPSHEAVGEHNTCDGTVNGAELAISYDLIWIRSGDEIEYFEGIF
jgi:Holliday junction resolvase-like predicted endonuclease